MKRPLTGMIQCNEENQYTGPHDTMILARCKHKYHGGYPAGSLERFRLLLVGGDPDAIIWHIPGGKARDYNGMKGGINLKGFGPNDKTIDLDPNCDPDFLLDVRNLPDHFSLEKSHILYTPPIPEPALFEEEPKQVEIISVPIPKAIIIDLPYDEPNAEKYAPGKEVFPSVDKLLVDALDIMPLGNLCGVLDWRWPAPYPSQNYEEVYVDTVTTGRSSRFRGFTVWRKIR
jgi:hypothetical protein